MDLVHGVLPAVHCTGLGKRYYFRDNDANLLKRLARKLSSKRRESRSHWALRNVHLTIQPGESVAVIGTNGSGKSTLLKLINGISQPNAGQLQVNGRVGGILELGAGFHPDLTGYENIFLQGTLLGLSRREIWKILPAIEEFCELGKFLNSPVRHYSMGMFLRLGFAIAVNTKPDIFIIDEALAVGDGYFMWKCTKRLKEMKENGLTLIYVSHVPEQVESLCERAIWIHKGEIRSDGPITEVIRSYHEFQFANLLEGIPRQVRPELSALIPYSRFGSGEVTLKNVRFCDANGKSSRIFPVGSDMEVHAEASAITGRANVALYLILEKPNQSVTFIDSSQHNCTYELREGNNLLSIKLEALALQPGPYTVTLAIGEAGNWENTYDAHQKIYSFTVTKPEDGEHSYSRGFLNMQTSIVQSATGQSA